MANIDERPTLAEKRVREEGDEEHIAVKRARTSSGELVCSESGARPSGLYVGESVEDVKRAFQKDREQRIEQIDQAEGDHDLEELNTKISKLEQEYVEMLEQHAAEEMPCMEQLERFIARKEQILNKKKPSLEDCRELFEAEEARRLLLRLKFQRERHDFKRCLFSKTFARVARGAQKVGTGAGPRQIAEGKTTATLENEFMDNVGVVENFRKFVWNCARMANSREESRRTKWHAIVALVQSRGFGKTRLCKQLLLRTYGMYWCLRPRGSPGYPHGSFQARRVLDAELAWRSARITIFRGACKFVQHVKEWHNVGTYNELLSLSEKRQAEIRKTWWNSHVNLEGHERKAQLVMEDSLERLRETMDQFFHCRWEDIEKAQNSRMFVVVIDDASHLGGEQTYRDFRVSVNQVADSFITLGVNFICVTADSSPKLADIVAPEKIWVFGPSHRPIDPATLPKDTFEPWLWLQCDFPPAEGDEAAAKRYQKYPQRWITYGRPLWRATYELILQKARDPGPALQELLRFVDEKLTCDSTQESPYMLMALLLARVYCDVGGSVAAEYVSKYMGTALSVSDDRKGWKVTTCPEPMVALAAYFYWEDGEKMLKIIDNAVKMQLWHLIAPGTRGEMVAQVLLAGAFEFGSQRDMRRLILRDLVMPVEKYLSNLGLPINEALKEESVAYSQGVVCVLQFLRCHESACLEGAVAVASERGCGVVTPPNYKGLDIIIPVYYGDRAKEDGQLVVMSLLLVKVKNRRRSVSSLERGDARSTLKLSPEYCFRQENWKFHEVHKKTGADGQQQQQEEEEEEEENQRSGDEERGLRRFRWRATTVPEGQMTCQKFLTEPCISLLLNLHSETAAHAPNARNICRVTVSLGADGPNGPGGPNHESSTDSFHVILSKSRLLGKYGAKMKEALETICDASFGEQQGCHALPGQLPHPCMVEFDPVNLD